MTAPALLVTPPGGVIGILGGGQLGRMLALAGARLGFDMRVLTPDADSPAARVCASVTRADYDDADAVRAFAKGCAVVTYEFENVPTACTAAAAAHAPVRPGVRALEVAQDRVTEKTFVRACGAETTQFVAIDTPADIVSALEALPAPALLKTRRLGYDGKGQAWTPGPDAAQAAFDAVGGAPSILEAKVAFVREVSQIAARGADGDIAFFALCENKHEGGILRETRAPAASGSAVATQAQAVTRALMEALDYVGVLTVEFFETADGALLVNEIAPRVHNSGHWTEAGASVCQFEQHIRAVAGWPLRRPVQLGTVRMENLIGPEGLDRAATLRADPEAVLHLYGKRAARSGRKIGHATWVTRS